jgi:hypothetical protein
VRLTDEPGATIRLLIGDKRADELGSIAFALHREHRFDTDELEYLAQCFDYLAWCSSGGDSDVARKDLIDHTTYPLYPDDG